jgi:hypothetical protein
MEQLPFLSPDNFAGACDELLISMERIERVDFDIKIRDEVCMATGKKSKLLHEAVLTYGLGWAAIYDTKATSATQRLSGNKTGVYRGG